MTRNHQAAYRAEAWFAIFTAACGREQKAKVAERLGVSGSVVSQVLHSTGLYGLGTASTERFATKVMHTFGRYECPHLTQQYGQPKVITADKCREYAHRSAPSGSPGDLAHWRACSTCPHKTLAVPAPPRVPKAPRRKAAAAPAATPTTLATQATQEHTA
jgi:hypothetical protein